MGWPFSAALGETIVRFRATAVLEPKGGFSGGIAGPAGNKAFRGQSLAMDFWRVVRRHGHQQFKGGSPDGRDRVVRSRNARYQPAPVGLDWARGSRSVDSSPVTRGWLRSPSWLRWPK